MRAGQYFVVSMIILLAAMPIVAQERGGQRGGTPPATVKVHARRGRHAQGAPSGVEGCASARHTRALSVRNGPL